jgi:hypothetical protein
MTPTAPAVEVVGGLLVCHGIAVFRAGWVRGSDGPVYYPETELRRSLPRWNGLLVTRGHPWSWGGDQSAREPGVWARFGLGHFQGAALVAGRVEGDVHLDLARLHRLAPRLHDRLAAGLPVSVSTGLYFGRHQGVAVALRPDHLGLLEGDGALPLANGYGLLVGRDHES